MDDLSWGRTLYRYRSGPALEAVMQYSALASDYEMSLTELSLRWCRERQGLTSVLVGQVRDAAHSCSPACGRDPTSGNSMRPNIVRTFCCIAVSHTFPINDVATKRTHMVLPVCYQQSESLLDSGLCGGCYLVSSR